ncbi:thiamine pyrophosphate-dependent enzyme [Roseivirga sp. BDSF3-8]|uniref:alpha-ketoacid dehydrogenase subunit alpha/beta n=1 Tax=Roseivirga sp. BDSF3-8 TaxID=3241598 RepID=UPI00353192A4
MSSSVTHDVEFEISTDVLKKAYRLMCTAGRMAEIYDENKKLASKYVHSTSRGHEAIQLAAAFHLKPWDYAAPYYRDESILLGIGMEPYELMLQLMAKRDDPFSGGRTYYNHPSLKREGMPTIPHQSSATGMQAIPATGMAHGIKYKESQGLGDDNKPVVLCSLGDGSVTEGEVSEAFQMAILKDLPIIYLIQDNDWGISATGEEMRAMDAYEFAAGFKGLKRMRVNGADFADSYNGMEKAVNYVRKNRKPILVHAKCPLLGHHTSGVRKEFYRDEQNLNLHHEDDPTPRLRHYLLEGGMPQDEVEELETQGRKVAEEAWEKAVNSPDPDPATVSDHEFAPTPITEETGEREPEGAEKIVMVDAALFAMNEIMKNNPEALLYGQDVGARLGGVFREAATLGKKYGEDRVFNTPIQEAYIVGSTAGMSAVGLAPVVEIQFADYIWPGINQLVEELSKSCYLSMGQFPVRSVIRVPIGAYGGGGPYHSGSVESTLCNIRGIKVVYPSTAADMKGLMKAAWHDPNPVVMLEHKGLYWSKVPGTEKAKSKEPSEDYVVPLGKARTVQEADTDMVEEGYSAVVITYGMGVYWTLEASKKFPGSIEILDLRTLNPLDWEAVVSAVRRHNKALVLTEEPLMNSFAESLAGRIAQECFQELDAPVMTLGALNLPAIALNMDLEKEMLPNADKVGDKLDELLNY